MDPLWVSALDITRAYVRPFRGALSATRRCHRVTPRLRPEPPGSQVETATGTSNTVVQTGSPMPPVACGGRGHRGGRGGQGGDAGAQELDLPKGREKRGSPVEQAAQDSGQLVGKMAADGEDPPSPRRHPGIRSPLRQREATTAARHSDAGRSWTVDGNPVTDDCMPAGRGSAAVCCSA